MRFNSAEVRILRSRDHAESIKALLKNTGWELEGDDLVYRSRLPDKSSVSDQLKWLHMSLEHDRKFIRQLESDDIHAVCRVFVRKGRTITIEPEALFLAHKFHIPLEVVLAQ